MEIFGGVTEPLNLSIIEIDSSLYGENVGMINPVITVCYSSNAGLTLDEDFALMVKCEVHKRTSTLECIAHMLALKLKREASQVCVCIETRPLDPCIEEQYDH